jgi:hypothetical protein
VLPALLRPVAALGGAGTDKIALHVCEAAEHGNLNISVAQLSSGDLGAQRQARGERNQVPTRLSAGAKEIRTLGPTLNASVPRGHPIGPAHRARFRSRAFLRSVIVLRVSATAPARRCRRPLGIRMLHSAILAGMR